MKTANTIESYKIANREGRAGEVKRYYARFADRARENSFEQLRNKQQNDNVTTFLF